MNVYNVLRSTDGMRLALPIGIRLACALALLLLSGALSASTPLDSVTSSVSSFCAGLVSLLPVVSMLMVVVGAVVYASGQIMGAETRARANVWATAALTGALIAMLINAVAPPVLTTIYGSSVDCHASGTGGPACGPTGTTCGSGADFCSGSCSIGSGPAGVCV